MTNMTLNRLNLLARSAGISTLIALSAFSVTAHASDADRARIAIAEARAKIEAGDKVGASSEAMATQGRARSSLQTAETYLAKGKKTEAIAEAHHAGELADMALVNTDRNKTAAERNGRLDAEASAADAQQSAVAANARADAAQQSAATATAEANALRAAPPVAAVVAVPAPVQATLTVKQETVHTPAAPVHKKTTHKTTHKPAAKPTTSATAKTTTTLTTK